VSDPSRGPGQPSLSCCARKHSPSPLPSTIVHNNKNVEGFALRLEGAGLLEEVLELAALEHALEVRVAADVLLGDPGVGDGALARDLLEGVLDGAAVFHLVELEDGVVGVELVEGRLRLAAVGAVALGEDDDVVLVDELLDFLLGGGHGFW